MIEESIKSFRDFIASTPRYLFLPFIFIIFLIPASGWIKNILYKKVKNSFYQSLKPMGQPSLDENSKNIYSLIQHHGFDDSFYNDEVQGDDVADLVKNNPDISFKVSGKQFSDFDHLLNYLEFISAKKEIYNASKYYYHKTDEKFLAADKILDHLDKHYIASIRTSIAIGNIGRAKQSVKDAYRIFSIIDTPPFGGVNSYSQHIINKILLLNTIFNDDELTNFDGENLLKIYDFIFNDFDDNNYHVVDEMLLNAKYQDILLYWKGVYFFRKYQWEEAKKLFNEGEVNSSNLYLKDLAILMQARCIYTPWKIQHQIQGIYNQQDTKKEVAQIKELERMVNNIAKKSIQNDVAYYIETMKEKEVISAQISTVPGVLPLSRDTQRKLPTTQEDEIIKELLKIIVKMIKEKQ